VLIALAVGGLAGALAIGVIGAFVVSALVLPLVAIGAVLVPAYNLELARGRVHSDRWFALAWGAFPAFTGYFVQTLTIRPAGILVAGACYLLSLAQRRLSTPVRDLRRRTVEVEGRQRMSDGRVLQLDQARLAAPLEGALSASWMALVLLAAGLIAARL
jgi:hypothetical protein